jgi:hypothetical protein
MHLQGPRNAEGLQVPFFYRANPYFFPDAVAKRREFAEAEKKKAAERKTAEANALAEELVRIRFYTRVCKLTFLPFSGEAARGEGAKAASAAAGGQSAEGACHCSQPRSNSSCG